MLQSHTGLPDKPILVVIIIVHRPTERADIKVGGIDRGSARGNVLQIICNIIGSLQLFNVDAENSSC